ncbi:MAG: hypothetical protein RL732_579 [Bacteroidota bacterium]
MRGIFSMDLKGVSAYYKWVAIISFLFLSACQGLSDEKATELVRLKYRQLNTTPGEGKWLTDSILIEGIDRIGKDSFSVRATVSGVYQLPVIEGTPTNPLTPFHDSLHFMAVRMGKVWLAKRWELFQADQ